MKYVWLAQATDDTDIKTMCEPYIDRYRLFEDSEEGLKELRVWAKKRGWEDPCGSMYFSLNTQPGNNNSYMCGDVEINIIKLPLPGEYDAKENISD